MSEPGSEVDLSAPANLLSETVALTRPPYNRVLDFMLRMHKNPPQSLLIEGGSCNERLAAALLWACLLNEDIQNKNPLDCLNSQLCKRFIADAHRDLFVLDGREESIKIAQVREEVRPVLGESPREAQKRIILLAEAQALGIEAANALLKSIEEPQPHNIFILTAPQRERLLPTLVSRSWILTLPWPVPGEHCGAWEQSACVDANQNQKNLQEWENTLANFLQTGQGWFARTGSRGALNKSLALGLLARCQAALAASMLQKQQNSPLARTLCGRINKPMARNVYEAFAVCQNALNYNVNPGMCMDWLAVKLFIWLEELRRTRK